MKAWRCWDGVEIFRFKLSLLWVRKFFLAIVFEMQTRDIAPSWAYTRTTGLTFSKDDKQHSRLSYHDNWLASFVGLQLTQDYRYSQPRSQLSSVISDVTLPVRACQVCLENLLGSKPPSLTRRTGMGTRLPLSVARSARPSKCELDVYHRIPYVYLFIFFYLLILIYLKCIKYQRLVCEMEIFILHHLNVNPH